MGRFDDKVVFLTGASAGIGAGLAREFARQGASLVLVARREDRLRALADELRAAGRAVEVVRGDVTNDWDLDAAAKVAVARFGRIDVVVANAGFGVVGRFEKLTLDDYRRQFETNVFGVLRTLYATLPELKKTKGVAVLLGSVSSYVSTPAGSPYAMSKYAVRALAESLHAELEPAGVGVVLIAPGFVESDIRKVDNQGRVHEDAKESVPKWLLMPTSVAVHQIVDAVFARKREQIVTFHGKMIVAAQRMLPGVVHWAMKRGVKKGRKEPKPAE